jgi:hypothetical protein
MQYYMIIKILQIKSRYNIQKILPTASGGFQNQLFY